MKRDQRLRRSADFQRVREHATGGWHDAFVHLYSLRSPEGVPGSRVGIIVSKRVARDAVKRNRVRRRLREAFRLMWPRLLPGYDVVVVARPASLDASWVDLRASLDSLLRRARLLQPPVPTVSPLASALDLI